MKNLVALPIVLPMLGAGLAILAGRWKRGAARRRPGDAHRRPPRSPSCCSSSPTATVRWCSRPAIGRRRSASPSSSTGCAAIMLTVGALMLLAVLVYAIGQPGAERHHVGFTSVYMILAAGVAGCVHHRRPVQPLRLVRDDAHRELRPAHPRRPREQVRAGMTYVVISLLASTLFITALAFIYSATGTVNMADLAGKFAELPTRTAPGVRRAARRRVRRQGRRCSHCSRGCPTATRRRRVRSPRCSPGCSPRSASTP